MAAITALSNLTIPSIFSQYVGEDSVRQNALIRAGVVDNSPQLAEKLAGGGTTFNFLSFKNIDETITSNIPTDDQAVVATPKGISSRKQIAVRLERNESWITTGIVQNLIGADPLAALSWQLGGFQAAWHQASLINTLKGVINTSVTGADTSRVNNIAVDSATANSKITAGAVMDTLAAFGDGTKTLEGYAIIMHSAVYRYLNKMDPVSFRRASEQTYGIPTYMGMFVIVDDSVPYTTTTPGTTNTKFTVWIVRPGAIAFGQTAVPYGIEVERLPLAGNGAGSESVTLRAAYAYHVNGFSFTGSAAGLVPTDAELATAAKWTQVGTTKQIGVVALVANTTDTF